MADDIPALRVDKWLWHARFYKSRGLAADAVKGGHVKVGGVRVKPASVVRPGDRVQVVRNGQIWLIEVLQIPARRGPAPEARTCYRELEGSREAREALAAASRADRRSMPVTDGRPDRQTRRRLIRHRRGSE